MRTADGVFHAADVLIYGTGFTASDFLMPMRIIGRGGVELHDHWKGDARASLGIALPGYPNLFLLYGPNTNIVVNGSITFFSECEVRYVVGCVGHCSARERRRSSPRRRPRRLQRRIDAENRQMAWGGRPVNSWYRNASGRVTQNWP